MEAGNPFGFIMLLLGIAGAAILIAIGIAYAKHRRLRRLEDPRKDHLR